MNEIIVGATYKHYKGNLYKVIALARHTETEEELVIYTDGEHTWARPKSMWNEIVNNQKRFELVTGEENGK
jgi:cyclomaltodextrinase / maltogenic alpha-amylase / neopullulanase